MTSVDQLRERCENAALNLERARIAFNEAQGNFAAKTGGEWIVATVQIGRLDLTGILA